MNVFRRPKEKITHCITHWILNFYDRYVPLNCIILHNECATNLKNKVLNHGCINYEANILNSFTKWNVNTKMRWKDKYRHGLAYEKNILKLKATVRKICIKTIHA